MDIANYKYVIWKLPGHMKNMKNTFIGKNTFIIIRLCLMVIIMLLVKYGIDLINQDYISYYITKYYNICMMCYWMIAGVLLNLIHTVNYRFKFSLCYFAAAVACPVLVVVTFLYGNDVSILSILYGQFNTFAVLMLMISGNLLFRAFFDFRGEMKAK